MINSSLAYSHAVPPVAPNVISTDRTTDETIKISWQKLTPDVARGLVTSYTITYKEDSSKSSRAKRQTTPPGGGMVVVAGNASQAEVKGLDGKLGYLLVMWANTSAGKGRETTPMLVAGEHLPHPF